MDYIALHDFLKTAERPMTIGQIHAVPPFSSFTRRQVAGALEMLMLSGIAFRRIHQGKAYYSADPREGSGINPSQSRLLSTVYKARAKEMSEARKQLRMMDELENMP